MFKEYELKSIKKDEVVLELNSSGTSGNKSEFFRQKKCNRSKNIFRKFYNKNLVKKISFFDTRSKPNPY